MDGGADQPIDSHSTGKSAAASETVTAELPGGEVTALECRIRRFSGKFPAFQGEINSFPGHRLGYAGGVSREQKTFAEAAPRRKVNRIHRTKLADRLGRLERIFQTIILKQIFSKKDIHCCRLSGEFFSRCKAKIGHSFTQTDKPGIAAGKEMDLDGSWNASATVKMRLKSHEPSGAFIRCGQAQSMGDPGIAPIGADQDFCSKILLGRRISACQNPSCLISA
jgi:hypothetical protein